MSYSIVKMLRDWMTPRRRPGSNPPPPDLASGWYAIEETPGGTKYHYGGSYPPKKGNTMSEFTLGAKLRDVVTGFEGIATSRIEYINGCVQYALVPKVDKDGKMPPGEYFDFQRLEQIGDPIEMPSRDGGATSMRDAPSVQYRG